MRFIESLNKIIHKLIPSWPSKDLTVFNQIVIQQIVVSKKGAVVWFSKPISKVSAHYVIGSAGNITRGIK